VPMPWRFTLVETPLRCLWSAKATGRSVWTGGRRAWQLRKSRDTAATVPLTQLDGTTQGGAMTDGGSGSERPDRPVDGRSVSAIDLIVATALLALLAFAPLADLAAAAQPLAPQMQPRLATLTGNQPNRLVRDLPADLPDGFTAGSPADLRAIARRALGQRGSHTLLTLLAPAAKSLQETAVGGRLGFAPYPYRYPAMTRLLDQAPGRAHTAEARNLGAALLLLASRPGEYGSAKFPNAPAAAYAVLDRARANGDCGAQLNLLLLVSADYQPRDAPVRDEARRAESVCPDDPTPGWLLGQYQSQRAKLKSPYDEAGDPVPADAQQQAAATFAQLEQRFPGSAAAITGMADAQLRAGLRLAESQPFTARHALRTAAAGYLKARSIEADGAVAGLARALIGLGEPARAAELVRGLVAGGASPGLLLELLTTAEVAAHEFGPAESTARQLADRGPAAYPAGPPLFAVPGGDGVSETAGQDPLGPQSLGTDTYAPFSVSLQPSPGGGGADVEDVSFIPVFRSDYGFVGTDPSCPGRGWRRDAVLAGRARAALADFPAGSDPAFNDVRPTRQGYKCEFMVGDLHDIARLEAGLPVTGDRKRHDELADRRQNLWRWAGNLPHAEQTIQAWAKEAGPTAPLPMLRLGEVSFLQRRYDDAAAAFGVAARRTRYADYNNDLGVYEAQLGQGASLLSAGRTAEGLALLRTVANFAEYGVAFHRRSDYPWLKARFGAVAYHARAQLADAERESGDLLAAVEDYNAARELLQVLPDTEVTGVRPERIDANQALADLALGRVTAATQAINRALRADPMNPAFLMTAGFVADRAGQLETAARYDVATLTSDPGAFPAANDLGVELARLQRNDEAVTALRRAVGARPDYALGWFNLGVVYSGMGPAKVLQSQGALARAFELDPALRDRQPALTIDAQIYRTGLDLSKPLPPGWSFAQLQDRLTVPSAGLLAVLVLGLGLARVAGSGTRTELAQGWLESAAQRLERLPLVSRLRNPWWALAVTVLVFALPLVLHARGRLVGLGALAVGVLLLALVAMWVRTLVARRTGLTVHNESWGPGVAFGMATAVVAPWAPLPVARTTDDAPWVHAAAPVALALVGVVLFVESVAFQVPLTRSLADAALIMVASTLVPVGPLDGAKLGKAGLLAGAGVVGAAFLVGLGVV
jgi:cellulose synthase operon protein C